MKRVNVGAEQLEKLQQLQKKIKEEATELQQELLAHMPSISAKYTISEEAYAEKQAELKRLQAIKQRAEKLQQQLEEIIAQREENNSATIGLSVQEILKQRKYATKARSQIALVEAMHPL